MLLTLLLCTRPTGNPGAAQLEWVFRRKQTNEATTLYLFHLVPQLHDEAATSATAPPQPAVPSNRLACVVEIHLSAAADALGEAVSGGFLLVWFIDFKKYLYFR